MCQASKPKPYTDTQFVLVTNSTILKKKGPGIVILMDRNCALTTQFIL